MALIMIAVTWRWAGYNAIILLAGLQSIPEDVYEAATLDRVSKVKQFFYITLPLLKPVIVFCVVLSIIGTMQLFTEPFLITERGGPGGGTETLGLLLYRQGFRSLNFGYASAIAYTMAALAIAISLVQSVAGEGTEMRSQVLTPGCSAASRCMLFLTPLALIWLFPLWMMVVFSTMPDNGIFSPGIELLPHGNFVDNFNNLQRDTNFVGAIGISVGGGGDLHRPLGAADLDGRLGAGALPVLRQGRGRRHHPRHHHAALFRGA